MEHLCFFCLKIKPNFVIEKEQDADTNSQHEFELQSFKDAELKMLEKFLNFLQRHLNICFEDGKKKYFSGQNVIACEGCLKIVKSFCDLYHDLKTIELLLNWQLWTLNEIMKDGKETSNNLQTINISQDPVNLENKAILELRSIIMQKCSSKLQSCYPRIILENLSTLGTKKDCNKNLSQRKLKKAAKLLVSKPTFYKKIVRKSIKILQNRFRIEQAEKENISSPKILNTIKVEPADPQENAEFVKQEQAPDKVISASRQKTVKTEEATELENSELAEDFFSITSAPGPVDNKESTGSDYPSRKSLRTVHKCNVCNKTFSTLESLFSHENTTCKEMLSELEAGQEINGLTDEDDMNCTSESDNSSDEETEMKPEMEEEINVGESELEESEDDKKSYVIVKNKNNRYQCCFCNRSVSRKNGVRPHILAMHPTKWNLVKFPEKLKNRLYCRFKCSNCGELFEKAHFLQLHWKTKHQPKETQSAISAEIVSFISDPKSKAFKRLHKNFKKPQHFAKIEIANPKEIFICEEDNCGKPFYSREDFQVHEKLHGSFSCKFCSEIKSFLPELAAHELKCLGIKRSNHNDHKCPRCDLKFKEWINYLRHFCFEYFSLKFNEFTCSVCKNYSAEIEQNVKRRSFRVFKHLKHFHNLEKIDSSKSGILRCDEVNCSAYFSDLVRMDYHKEVDHGLGKAEMNKVRSARISVCETCGKKFKSEERLNVHFLSHSGPQSWQFSCQVCSKKCLTESKLKEHMRVHTNEKPFVCEVCGAKYSHRHNLRIHVNNKHGDVVQDIPQKYDASNLSSRKGVKRKAGGNDKSVEKKRRKKKGSEESVTEQEKSLN